MKLATQNSSPDLPSRRPVEVPPRRPEVLAPEERLSLRKRIKSLLRQRRAILVAHYYTSVELQTLADETGGCVSDSLEMARFGHESAAKTLVVCGVRFMGETAKILNPEKRILMPDLAAECSLDLGCPPRDFQRFCGAHPERTVVVYANTSAAVKACADWMVTSGSALEVARHLRDRGEPILWAPDKYLGDYVRRRSGADMLLWDGACVVHEEFKGRELAELRVRHPEAKVLAHPESPTPVLEQADLVGSTTDLIQAVRRLKAQSFIVATDQGIFHKMREAAPGKSLLPAPTSGKGATCKSCNYCPWMAMNGLRGVAQVLESGDQEIHVDPELRERALLPIHRLLRFTTGRKLTLYGNNDA